VCFRRDSDPGSRESLEDPSVATEEEALQVWRQGAVAVDELSWSQGPGAYGVEVSRRWGVLRGRLHVRSLRALCSRWLRPRSRIGPLKLLSVVLSVLAAPVVL